jgi:urea transporter
MKIKGPLAATRRYLADTARAYSALFFLDSPTAGALLLAGTFAYPNIGFSGLVAALAGQATARIFRFPDARTTVFVLNSLLVGLSLGAFYQLSPHLLVLVVGGAMLAVLASAGLADLFWRHERLPVLVIPFLLVAAITALVARQLGNLAPFFGYSEFAMDWLPYGANEFLSLLGATFFTIHPVAGAAVLAVITWRSRYLALLAVAATLVGQGMFLLLDVNQQPLIITWAGFNMVLTAIAIGGIYTVPGLASFITAMLAAALTTLLLIACQNLLFVHGLPLIALPYIVVTLLFLLALRTRISVSPPWLATQPGMPEENYERARLAQVRNGGIDSVPLLLPVFGRWQIYQGFDGEHTHKPPWHHALDFYMTEEGKSFSGDGARLEDFYCFGLPVVSPAHGQVVRVRDHLADNPPGDVDLRNNWGNLVLIRLGSGLHMLLAHLKQSSVKVKEGDWVEPGKPLAACGNSGRSPQPHLHLQVQRSAQLGSPTHPFHLCSLLHHRGNSASEYLVNTRPRLGDSVEAAVVDPRIATPLHLPVGRQLSYRIEGPGLPAEGNISLQVELTLTGQFRLVSDTGASAAFEENNGVLAFYDRQGPRDRFLDIWLLANGLTPLSESAVQWRDAPSAALLPLAPTQRSVLRLLYPLGQGLDSRYRRQFDRAQGAWRQGGHHELRLGARILKAETESLIDGERGFYTINCRLGSQSWRAHLTELGLAGDEGVPGWQMPSDPDEDLLEESS